MNELDRRISEALRAEGARVAPSDPGLRAIVARGERRRHRRHRIVASAAAAAFALVVAGTFVVARHDQSESPRLAPVRTVVDPDSSYLEIPPATQVDPQFDWQVRDDVTSGLGATRFDSFGATPQQYALSTQPGRDDSGATVVYSLTDGVNWTQVSQPLDGIYLSDLAGGADGHIYAIGTGPGAGADSSADSTIVYNATSTDGGATFVTDAASIDLAGVRSDIERTKGFVSVGNSRIASTGSATVSAIDVTVSAGDLTQWLPAGTLAPFGLALGDDGIDIYGPVDTDIVARSTCPVGWQLQAGDPRPTDAAAGAPIPLEASTTSITATDGTTVARQAWRCAPPAGTTAADLAVDPAEVHGAVVETVPFGQLGLHDDTIAALRESPRLFIAGPDGAWTETVLPTAARGQVSFFTADADGFALALTRSTTDDLSLWLSVDGLNWSQGTSPLGLAMQSLTPAPGGGWLATGTVGAQLVVARSSDGVTWSERSINRLVGDDGGVSGSVIVYGQRLAASASGTAMLVTTLSNPLGRLGGATVSHDGYTLRIEDAGLTVLTLLDASGERIDQWSALAKSQSASGLLRPSMNGYAVIDPSTGAPITTFTGQEISDAVEAVTASVDSSDDITITYVVATTDGERWSAERLDAAPISMSSSEISSASNSFASGDSLAFSFARSAPVVGGSDTTATTIVGTVSGETTMPPLVLLGTLIERG